MIFSTVPKYKTTRTALGCFKLLQLSILRQWWMLYRYPAPLQLFLLPQLLVGVLEVPVEIAPQLGHKGAEGAGEGLRVRAVEVDLVPAQAALLRRLQARLRIQI